MTAAALHLEFELGADTYLLPAAELLAILALPELKALPGAPEGVAGLLLYRGEAIPVIDLARIALGRPSADRRSTRLALVRFPTVGGERPLGVIVEGATAVRRVDDSVFAEAGAPSALWLGDVARAGRDGGLVQRVRVAGLLPPGLRDSLFLAATEAGTEARA